MEAYHIRPEQADDFEKIFVLNEQAFGTPAESLLIDKLRAEDAFISNLSLVAVQGDTIIGHILFTPILIEGTGKPFDALALAPMSVLPDYQNKKIGSNLVLKGLETARQLGHTSVIVLGHPQYYPRFGFVPASHYKITCPFEVPDDVFMALELVEGALVEVSGQVKYLAPFMEG